MSPQRNVTIILVHKVHTFSPLWPTEKKGSEVSWLILCKVQRQLPSRDGVPSPHCVSVLPINLLFSAAWAIVWPQYPCSLRVAFLTQKLLSEPVCSVAAG